MNFVSMNIILYLIQKFEYIGYKFYYIFKYCSYIISAYFFFLFIGVSIKKLVKYVKPKFDTKFFYNHSINEKNALQLKIFIWLD